MEYNNNNLKNIPSVSPNRIFLNAERLQRPNPLVIFSIFNFYFFSETHWNGDTFRDKSVKSISRENSFYSDTRQDSIANSWWYLFCIKCRQEESTNAWEPPHWQKVCPYPFCPTYRYFARLLSLFLVGLLLWGIVFSVLGETAGPGGQLFGLAVLCICAKFGGWFVTIFTLPALVGMLLVGIIFQNVTVNGGSIIDIEGDYLEVCSVLR